MLFWKKKTGIYPAPLKSDCYFFSNNLKLKNLCTSKGWKFIFINKFKITNDYRVSSLQRKYIKFLQFDKNYLDWSPSESILYFDHKLKVCQNHIVKANE